MDTWHWWLHRWDAQQEVYIEQRERIYTVMFELLAQLAPPDMRVLDLAAGPGAVSKRLLERFPQASCVALDVDPVLLAVGQGALGDMGGRLQWLQADLRDPDWYDQLVAAKGRDVNRDRSDDRDRVESVGGDGVFDVVVSSTATHWLLPAELTGVYARLADLLTDTGVFINADGMPMAANHQRILASVRVLGQQRQTKALAAGDGEHWDDWWDALRQEPTLAVAFAERDQIFPPGSRSHRTAPSVQFQQAALREAGFGEVAPVYQDLTHHLMLALR